MENKKIIKKGTKIHTRVKPCPACGIFLDNGIYGLRTFHIKPNFTNATTEIFFHESNDGRYFKVAY